VEVDGIFIAQKVIKFKTDNSPLYPKTIFLTKTSEGWKGDLLQTSIIKKIGFQIDKKIKTIQSKQELTKTIQ
jgi:hypothetical protein